jgi:hypothetical protein
MDIDRIKKAVEEYVASYRRADLPRLEVSRLYALFPDQEEPQLEIAWRWPEPWPNGLSRGVYFVFARGGRLLYVGKGSGMKARIGNRLTRWFQTEKATQACKVVDPGWTEKPMYVATVAVADHMSFEACALEEYLIQKLSPPDNVIGRRDELET